MTQQLVARIKRNSKYAYQAPEGDWFDVRVVPDTCGYELVGNNNRYRFSDVYFGIRIDNATVVDLRIKRHVVVTRRTRVIPMEEERP